MDIEDNIKQVPANVEDEHGGDGFDQPGDQSDHTIIGSIEKFVDGDWTTGGLPGDPKRRLVAVETDVVIRRWRDNRVIEIIREKPLPDLDLLNKAVPRGEWEDDLNGDPRPPYERAHVVYLVDLDTCERSTFISPTKGAAIAVSRLKDKVFWMRKMRGNNNIVPQIELSWAPMPTKYGMRKRPDFKVVGWIDLSGGSSLPPPSGPKQLPPVQPKQVQEPSLKEELNDDIPL
jgi:hypothetical protein